MRQTSLNLFGEVVPIEVENPMVRAHGRGPVEERCVRCTHCEYHGEGVVSCRFRVGEKHNATWYVCKKFKWNDKAAFER